MELELFFFNLEFNDKIFINNFFGGFSKIWILFRREVAQQDTLVTAMKVLSASSEIIQNVHKYEQTTIIHQTGRDTENNVEGVALLHDDTPKRLSVHARLGTGRSSQLKTPELRPDTKSR